jgi:hypothetical protein
MRPFILFILLSVFSCTTYVADTSKVKPIKKDTARIQSDCPPVVVCKTLAGDSLRIAVLSFKLDSVNKLCIVFKHKQDSLRTSLLLANSIIIKAKKYVRIVINNPSQKIYIIGWLRVVFGL